MFCINCGLRLSIKDKYCRWCGPVKGCRTPFGKSIFGERVTRKDWDKQSTSATESILSLKDIQQGDNIPLGKINREKIYWRVLQVEDDKALIFSITPVCIMPYHIPGGPITWSECTLREWLNSVFINRFFNKEERSRMIQTTVINEDNPDYHTPGGPPTTDTAFLLSRKEFHLVPKIGYMDDGPTWWLRTPGNKPQYAQLINHEGFIYPGTDVDCRLSVCPAMWIKIT